MSITIIERLKHVANSISHQKKALSFMMKREQGWECNGSTEDLWVKEVDETGQLMYVRNSLMRVILTKRRYTNMITELSQKQQPPDCRSGLLADQMGLGKTLTMISLIALNPSISQEPIKFTTQGSLRCIKSTLIVVPFTCEQLDSQWCKSTLLRF